MWGEMDEDERMTLEEFLVDVERQEAVGVVAGNGECRLSEVVGIMMILCLRMLVIKD